MKSENIITVNHPLIKHKLSIMRMLKHQQQSFVNYFVRLAYCLHMKFGDLETEEVSVQTPLELVKVPKIVGKKLCFIWSLERATDF